MKAFRVWNSTGCKLAVLALFCILALQVGISTAFADDMVKRAQEALSEKGFDPGPVDGRWGPNTKGAVMKFQEGEGLPATGLLDDQTKNLLHASMGDPAPAASPASTAERMPEGNTGPDVADSEIAWGRHK